MATRNTQQQCQSLAEGVDKELTCAICLCRYTHPKVLPCLHSYCKECLEKLAKGSHPKQEITCPQCKEVHQIPPQGVDSFKTYFTVNNLLELLRVHEATASTEGGPTKPVHVLCESGVDENPALAHCLTCSDHLCESCFELHKKLKVTRDHNVVLLKDLQQMDRKVGMKSVRRKLHCEEHTDEPLKLFCKICQKVICRDCALVKHREHDYVFVHEFRSKAQRVLEELVEKTREKQAEFKEHSEHLAKIRETSSTAFHANKQELNAVFDKLIKCIEARRKALLADLETLRQIEDKKFNAETDYLEMALARFSNSIQFTEKLFDNEDDVEMMLMSTQAKPALENLQQLSWDLKKADIKPVRIVFDQKDLKKCGSVGCVLQTFKDDDVHLSKLLAEIASDSFVFNVSLSPEVTKLGIDFTPVLYVQVTSPEQVEQPVEIQSEGLNKWKVVCTCTSNEIGQHKVTVKVDTVVKVHQIMIKPGPAFFDMKVVRGPDWDYGNQDGGAGTVGEVTDIGGNSTVYVKWPNEEIYEYRWGMDGKYDLMKA